MPDVIETNVAPSLTPATDQAMDENERFRKYLNVAGKMANEATGVSSASINFTGLDPKFEELTQRMSRPALTPQEIKNQFIAQSSRPGVALDVESGAPFWQRLGAAFRTDPAQQIKYWQKKYGQENVRLGEDGSIIVRTQDEQGKPKDLRINDWGISAEDFTNLVGIAPEIAGSVVAMGLAKKIPQLGEAGGGLGWLRDLVSGTIGAEAGGVLKDVATRWYDQMNIEPGKVLRERVGAIPADLMFGAALATMAKAGSKLITPFGDKIPPIQIDAREAQEYWRKQGIDFPLSAGQKTGNRFLLRSEMDLQKQVGTQQPFTALKEAQDDAVKQMENVIQGLPKDTGVAGRNVISTLEDLMDRMKTFVQGKVEPLEQNIMAARTKAIEDANNEILKSISTATMPQRQLYLSKIGESIRNKVEANLSAFKAEDNRLYEAAYSLPGGRDRILIPGNLAEKARNYLEKELPSVPVKKELDTGLLDMFGKSIIKSEQKLKPLEPFIPEGVLGKLRSLAAEGDNMFSLQDLVQMRTEVRNAIQVGEALPGVKAFHLRQMEKMLTEGIEDATSSLPDGALKAAWQTANKFHADNIGQFQTPLVSTILRPVESAGFVGDRSIVDRVLNGSDKIDELKKFFGPTSNEFKMLKRGIADLMYENSVEGNLLNAKSYMDKLENLRATKREIFDEVYGPQGDKILNQARIMGLAESDKIDAAVFDAALGSKPGTVPNLSKLVRAQQELDRVYKNDILKAIGSKTLPGNGINPSEFVARFLNTAKPQEMAEFMALVENNPTLTWQLRAKTVEHLLEEAARTPTPQDQVAMQLNPQRVVSAYKLDKIMSDKNRYPVLKSILGDETIDSLRQMARVLKPLEAQESSFSTAGGISAGMQIAGLFQGRISRFIDKVIHNSIGAFLITAPGFKQWASNTIMTPERTHALMTAAISSRPFIDQLINDYGQEKAVYVIQATKNAMDQVLRYETQNPAASTNAPNNYGSIMEFLRSTNQPSSTIPTPP